MKKVAIIGIGTTPIQTDVKDPLKKKIKYGEIWKKYLIQIYQYCQEKKKNI